jgi:hypothetical protein
MDLVAELESIDAALRILKEARTQLVHGPKSVWRIVLDASRHLEERADGILAQMRAPELEPISGADHPALAADREGSALE